MQSSWQRITLETYSKCFQLFWMWQDRMLEMVEVVEWKTSWEYDSGLVITTWRAIIRKNDVRIQHTVLSLAKLLVGMLTNKNQVLDVYNSGLCQGKDFVLKKDIPKSFLTSRMHFQNEFKGEFRFPPCFLAFVCIVQSTAGREAASDIPNYSV